MRLSEPLDSTHVLVIEALRQVRLAFASARERAATWEPAPCPADWRAA